MRSSAAIWYDFCAFVLFWFLRFLNCLVLLLFLTVSIFRLILIRSSYPLTIFSELIWGVFLTFACSLFLVFCRFELMTLSGLALLLLVMISCIDELSDKFVALIHAIFAIVIASDSSQSFFTPRHPSKCPPCSEELIKLF